MKAAILIVVVFSSSCALNSTYEITAPTIKISPIPQTPQQTKLPAGATTDSRKVSSTTSVDNSSPSYQDGPTKTPIPTFSSLVTPTFLEASTPQPKPSSSPTKANCLETKGKLEYGSLESEHLRSPLEFRIYLPKCYEEETAVRYPVLYLFHGQGFKDDQWDRIGADETADRLINSREIPPLIIVMPYERFGGQPDESSFAKVLVEEFIPHIDQAYRTKADRGHRAVGGLSRGGGWAIHFGLRYWKIFGALGGHSPAVFFSDAEQMRSVIDSIPLEDYPRIYLDIGERDRPEILRAALWFEELLNEKDVPHEWHLFSGYHNEDYWRAHMPQYLRWYSQSW